MKPRAWYFRDKIWRDVWGRLGVDRPTSWVGIEVYEKVLIGTEVAVWRNIHDEVMTPIADQIDVEGDVDRGSPYR